MKNCFADEWTKLKLAADQANKEFDENAGPHPNQQMCALVIAGEDHRFKYHHGVDPFGLCRAAWRTYCRSSREGGSTIAMQLVRTLTGKYEKTFERKIWEIQLALRLTGYIPKQRIPSLYLWVAYYGWRMNNFTQACDRLIINPQSATLHESARLVACLKYPLPRTINANRGRQLQMRTLHLIRRHEMMNSDNNSSSTIADGTFQNSHFAG